MALLATTAITGPNGEQIDPGTPIPESWPLGSQFVQEGIAHGWLVEDEEAAATSLPPTPPKIRKPRAGDPYSEMAVGGTASRTQEEGVS